MKVTATSAMSPPKKTSTKILDEGSKSMPKSPVPNTPTVPIATMDGSNSFTAFLSRVIRTHQSLRDFYVLVSPSKASNAGHLAQPAFETHGILGYLGRRHLFGVSWLMAIQGSFIKISLLARGLDGIWTRDL